MAKVAAAPSSLSNGSGALKTKRRAPAEIRVEQLKRNAVELVDQSSPSLLQSSRMVDVEFSKLDNWKYTRLNEVYPSVKPSSRMRLLSLKSNAKGNEVVGEGVGSKNSSLPPNLTPKCDQKVDSHDNVAASNLNVKESASQRRHTTEKCSEMRFLSVNELSQSRNDSISRPLMVDMDKAWKGFASLGPSDSGFPDDSLGKSGESRSKFPDVNSPGSQISGKKVPLDLTLKTKMRIVSTSPISWFHRVVMSSTYNGMAPLPTQFCNNHNISIVSNTMLGTGDYGSTNSSSWVYPHSSLPSSVIAALASATGGVESDFLVKRQLDWEDSFRNLYYMLRKNACDIFYVCTPQFVVMFTAIGASGKTKRKCNAYISQSTRVLRSLLREHDVHFSMPLCLSEEEQTSREDLAELSEMEKRNLGQTNRRSLMSDVDDHSQSLLAFHGNERTHELYDFLLNYKSFMNSLNGSDVPVLCAPLPFRNGAPSAPEVRCKEIKTVDHSASQFNGFTGKDDKSFVGSSGGICYSIEIKDVYITPWVIDSLCTAMGSEGRSYEASFTPEPNSLGLNAAIDAIAPMADPQESRPPEEGYRPLGMTAAVSSRLRSSWIKMLKCCDGYYTASLTPI
ncbi:hypothetical protein Dimus_029933 [Dionaea muscipula]